jgi:hypothetical protein
MIKLVGPISDTDEIRFANLPGEDRQLNTTMPQPMLEALRLLATKLVVSGSAQDLTMLLLEQALCSAAKSGLIPWPSRENDRE